MVNSDRAFCIYVEEVGTIGPMAPRTSRFEVIYVSSIEVFPTKLMTFSKI